MSFQPHTIAADLQDFSCSSGSSPSSDYSPPMSRVPSAQNPFNTHQLSTSSPLIDDFSVLNPFADYSSSSSYDPPRSFPSSNSRTKLQDRSPEKLHIPHPYARLYAKKEDVKRRKIWNHALEKNLFNPYELSTLGAPHRRTIYVASLEAHIEKLHTQLLEIEFWPVAFDKLEPYKGLNSKTAKSMVAGLQHDASVAKLKLLELERSNEAIERVLASSNEHQWTAFPLHTLTDSVKYDQ